MDRGADLSNALFNRPHTLDMDVYPWSSWPTLDAALGSTLRSFFFYSYPAITPYRRVLRWMLSPACTPSVASIVAREAAPVGKDEARTPPKDPAEVRSGRLSLLRDDAWKRRRQLTLLFIERGLGGGKAAAVKRARK